MDINELKAFALRVWKYKEGQLVSMMIHLGDRLGLYSAMAEAGSVTPQELAAATDTAPRWIEEWLLGQAAAGLVEKVGDDYSLSEVGATVLAHEAGSVFFAAGAFTDVPGIEIADRVAHAFETGRGFTYEEQGELSTRMTERVTAPSFTGLLIPMVLPRIEGLVERLESGATVADVGCGSGAAVEALARRFPASRFIGLDPSPTAIARARTRTADLDNAAFHPATAEELPGHGPVDVVLALDCLHDMPRPDLALLAAHEALRDDGVLVIKDIKSAPRFEDNLRNPVLAMQYGFSVTSCLPSALSTDDGLGLGTLGFNAEVAREMTATAGFTRVTIHDVDDPTNLYYEVRP